MTLQERLRRCPTDNSVYGEAADAIDRLTLRLAKAEAALLEVKTELLPAEQTNYLSASGQRCMAIIRAALAGIAQESALAPPASQEEPAG